MHKWPWPSQPSTYDWIYESSVNNLRKITHIFTVISQLLRAASKPCKKDKNKGKESDKREINE